MAIADVEISPEEIEGLREADCNVTVQAFGLIHIDLTTLGVVSGTGPARLARGGTPYIDSGSGSLDFENYW